MNATLANGETNWLEGFVLVIAYIFIAMIYFCEGKGMGGSDTVYEVPSVVAAVGS